MNKRSLIALSIAVALAAPSAFAQDRGQSAAHANANAAVQSAAATPAVPATPAIPATPAMQDVPAVPATPAIPATPAVPPVDLPDTDLPDTQDPQDQDLPPPLPVQAQADVHARAHSSVATRATFGEFDVDHDGRISIGEAEDDEGLSSGFSNMDANDDGFVSAVEYRLAMKGMLPQQGDDSDED